MPERRVALLRGINVGRAKRVAMADLRSLFTSLGHAQVRTLLNSGNVVFDAPSGTPAALAGRLRAALQSELDVAAEVIVKSRRELDAIVRANPLLDVAADPSRLLIVFTQQPAALSALAELGAVDWSPEALAIGKQAAYLWCPAGIIESKLAQAMTRALGERATMRNWATVGKLQAMLRDA